MNEKLICKFCNKEFTTYVAICAHIGVHGNINSKEYYDTYFKLDTDGCCKVCGSETSFGNFNIGYHKYCSVSCSSKDTNLRKQIGKSVRRKSIIKKQLHIPFSKKEKYQSDNVIKIINKSEFIEVLINIGFFSAANFRFAFKEYKYLYIRKYIHFKTKNFNKFYKVSESERIYAIINNLTDRPKCNICNKYLPYRLSGRYFDRFQMCTDCLDLFVLQRDKFKKFRFELAIDCKICDRKFKNNHSLVNHLNKCHNEYYLNKCKKYKEEYLNEIVTELEIYRSDVDKYTRFWIPYKFKSDDLKKRGRKGIDFKQIDHMYSVYMGFTNKIDPYVIGHYCNLVYIDGRENIIKSKKCSITIDDLNNNIELFDKNILPHI